jgi:ergothioneine biosynthesis protein EgtB
MDRAQLVRPSAPSAPSLAADYLEVRQASVALAAPLEPEDCVVQTIPEVSPTKWHLAHVTWFFERFCLREFVDGYEPFDEQFHYLFNSYYYSVGKMHPRAERGLLNRPLLRTIFEYRDRVDEAMLDLIAARGDDERLAFTVTLGLHHEQQHQELLLTDIKHVFFTNPLGPVYADPPAARPAADLPHEFVPQAGGTFAIGASGSAFCFDNETPRHDVLVGEHALGNRLVTNREYREFIDDGGYEQSQLWLADGWARIQSEQWSRPLYWSADLEREFTLGGWRPIDPLAPVCHVSHYEADAFARWAGARLPLEPEWELAAADTPIAGNLLERGALHPQPVTENGDIPHFPPKNGDIPRFGDKNEECPRFRQIWGDVWEWTGSPYGPYPRFRPLAGSLGEYNGKFMANQMVVRGGSCATWATHLRASYRSFFYPHDRWQFLGVRLAKDN